MSKQVKIYSTPACSFCIRAKQFLRDNNVSFEDIDVSVNSSAAQEMMQKTGQIGVPILDIDGEIIIGFDKDKIKKALGL